MRGRTRSGIELGRAAKRQGHMSDVPAAPGAATGVTAAAGGKWPAEQGRADGVVMAGARGAGHLDVPQDGAPVVPTPFGPW